MPDSSINPEPGLPAASLDSPALAPGASAPAWQGRVTDDRGVSHALVSLNELRADARMADPRFRVVVGRVRGQVRSAMRTPVLAAVMGGCAPLLMSLVQRWGVPPWAALLPIIGVAVFLGRYATRRTMNRAAPAIATVMVTDGLCPVCAYSFEGLSLAADGCYECPECGAAWRESRVVRRTRFDEDASGTGGRAGGGGGKGTRWWDRAGVGFGMRRLRDDRGTMGPVVDARFREELRACVEPGRAERMRGVRAVVTRGGVVVRWLLALVYVALAAMMVFAATRLPSRAPTVMGAVTVLSGVMFVGFGGMLLRSNLGMRKRVLRRECLARGLCPRCAADLGGREADADGMIACRECAAVWRAADIGTTAM